MRIALDAMGGDDAPAVNVEGAIAALDADPQLLVDLVGDPALLEPLLSKAEYDSQRLSVVAAADVVRMDEKPTAALSTAGRLPRRRLCSSTNRRRTRRAWSGSGWQQGGSQIAWVPRIRSLQWDWSAGG